MFADYQMHPCCGGSLQTGTKVIAVAKMVLSLISVLLCALATVQLVSLLSVDVSKNIYTKADARKIGVRLIASSIGFVVFAGSLTFAILLFEGAHKRNRKMCMAWFTYDAILLVIAIIQLLIGLCESPTYTTCVRFGWILLHSYFFWVVGAFISELHKEPEPVTTPYANTRV